MFTQQEHRAGVTILDVTRADQGLVYFRPCAEFEQVRLRLVFFGPEHCQTMRVRRLPNVVKVLKIGKFPVFQNGLYSPIFSVTL